VYDPAYNYNTTVKPTLFKFLECGIEISLELEIQHSSAKLWTGIKIQILPDLYLL
jgi:hypothetical protein